MHPSPTIQHHFNRASASYDHVASIQKQSAAFLVEKLRAVCTIHPDTILDLGTGTGYMPELLMPHYPKALYTLNDLSPNMLNLCALKFGKHRNVTFLNADMQTADFGNHDLITSNLALQWVNDLSTTLKKFQDKSEMFAFSTLLEGSFEEWKNMLGPYVIEDVIKKYPTEEMLVDDCSRLMEGKPFHYWTKDFQMTFENPLQFMRYLKNLGAGIATKQVPMRTLRSLIKHHCDDKLTVTYKIFFGVLTNQNRPSPYPLPKKGEEKKRKNAAHKNPHCE